MNYQRIYDQLVAKAQLRGKPEGYSERHHIVPKSMGGSNDKSNLVALTAREHFIAHLLLAKIHGGKMWAAVHKMTQINGSQQRNYRITSRTFDSIRKGIGELCSRNIKSWRKKNSRHANAIQRGNILNSQTQEARSKASLRALAQFANGPESVPNYKGPVIGTNINNPLDIVVLRGSKEIENAGFSYRAISSCITGKRKTYANRTWVRETIRAIKIDASKYTKKKTRLPSNKNPIYKGAVLGISVSDPFDVVKLKGALQMEEAGFDSKCIYSCISGKKKTHKNRVWKRSRKPQSWSAETLAKRASSLVEYYSKNEHTHKGIPRTEKTKKKISEALTGRYVKASTREKISQALTGKKLTEQTKQKLSIAHTGYVKSAAHIEQYNKPIIEKTTGKTFPSLKEVKAFFNISPGFLDKLLKANRVITKGKLRGLWFCYL